MPAHRPLPSCGLADRRRADNAGHGTNRQGNSLPLRGMTQTRLNELGVAHSRGTRRLWKARVVLRIGENPWKRIHLYDVRLARRVQSHIDARPVTTTEDAIGVEDNGGNPPLQRRIDPSGTFKIASGLSGRSQRQSPQRCNGTLRRNAEKSARQSG